MFRINETSLCLIVLLWALSFGQTYAQNSDSAMVRNLDPEQFFYGAYPQLNLTQTEGWPHKLPEIRINGKLDMKPLVLIDGMEGDLMALDMKDVVSIEVLSSPVDIAPYGYKGINGVVKVRTKAESSSGRPVSVSYTGSVSMFSRTVYPKVSFDLMEWVDVIAEGKGWYSLDTDTRFDAELAASRLAINSGTDWENLVFDKVFWGTEHRIGVSGGGKAVQYYVSGSFMSQGGIYSGYEKYNHATLHAGLTVKPVKWWVIRNIIGYSYRNDDFPIALNDLDYYSMGGIYDALSRFGYPYAVPMASNEYTREARGTRFASMMNKEDYSVLTDSRFNESLQNTFILYNDPDAHDLRLNLGLSLQWNKSRSLTEHELTTIGDKSYDERFSTDVYRGDVNMEYTGRYRYGWNLRGSLGFEAYHIRQAYEDQFVTIKSGIQETVDRSYGYKQNDYRQYLSLELDWKNRYELSFAQSHDAVSNDEFAWKLDRDYNPESMEALLFIPANPEEIIKSNALSGRIAWVLTEEPFMKSVRDAVSLARFSFSAGRTQALEDCVIYGLNTEGGVDLGFMKNRLRAGAKIFRNRSVHNIIELMSDGTNYRVASDWDVKGWCVSLSWNDFVKAGKHDLSYAVYTDVWDTEYRKTNDAYPNMLHPGQILGYASGIDPDNLESITVLGNSTPRYRFNFGLNLNYAGFGFEALFNGVGKRDWVPDVRKDDLFFGASTVRDMGLVLEKFRDVEYRSDAAPDAYWVKEFRTYGSDIPKGHYIQNASFLRLKHLRLDYTFEGGALEKSRIRSICVFCEGKNLFYITPMHKFAPDIDPEAIYISEKIGAGDGYPLLRTVELGVSMRF